MPDVTLSDAIKEAYASAPSARPVIHTLSIYYVGLLVAGVPDEIYIYQGVTGDRYGADDVPRKDFRLESGARFHSRQIVEFMALPFDFVPADVTPQGAVRGQVSIDGVGRDVVDIMMAAADAGKSVELTYRAYLETRELIGPENVPALAFTLTNIHADSTRVSGDISLPNMTNARFPGEVYTRSRFPGLG